MKKSRYSESQIVAILKQNRSGVSVSELCREYGMSQATFYQWRSKYGDADGFYYYIEAVKARLHDK